MAECVLDGIVRRKRQDVSARLQGVTLDPEPTRKSLRSALARRGARFIMEVKKASPSGHRGNVGVAEAAAAYAPVADAISVLTDEPYFSGSLDDLRAVRAGFAGPILAKDFVIDAKQVTEARAHGADAVLAILAALNDDEAADVISEARRLGMDVIVEVHDRAELQRAIALDARIIGINNRDLRTLETDLAVTERLAGLVPEDRIVVSESGIRSRRDVERLSEKVDAYLVGSSLMASSDIAQAARALVFGPVKICGLTRSADVAAAAAAGATHAGFVFVDGSPRRVGEEAAGLAAIARERGVLPVGVFGDVTAAEIVRIASEHALRAVQLHGRHDLKQLRKGFAANCEIWAVSGVDDVVEPTPTGADRTLFDTRLAGRAGGTGKAFDWDLIAAHPDLPNGFLAGGIGPANARAAQRVGTYGVDLCSSVEATPGRKDPAKLRALFEELRLPSRGSLQC
ncbi:bifunctional indole-3-glycerol-phosphate synthase TrpC/phosphoribosylanthranilate isomerase TrpF [Sphingomonas sp. RB56-2]|uniref:Multifunctional fusion protein n=1 Tax=Sphingomonas brevis TaxID=2908206 RepID=A0ABT0SA11_9SPHN|nr:bifunctional indole-3-glycerol-phosphate synthase TrpC/phosphoribosylanthranilate isomerase TrpF [Sphingomonas brevis]